jgi:hypothetical protein
MKNPYYDKLILLYSKNTIKDILADKNAVYSTAFPDVEQLVERDKTFVDLKNEIQNLAELIEKRLLINDLGQDTKQVRASLTFALNISLFQFHDLDERLFLEKMQIIKDLILKRFESGWSTEVKEHFMTSFDRVINSKILFISYTNKDANIVNLKYKSLILEVIEKYGFDKPLKDEDWKKRNLVAMALSRVLSNVGGLPSTRIFFDRDDLEPGDKLKKEILPICNSSLQFLQIISSRVFLYEHLNWAYEEFSGFNGGKSKKKAIFTIVGNAIPPKPPFFNPDYQEWYQMATDDTLYEMIPETIVDFETTATRLAESMNKFLFQDVIEP